MSTPGVTSVLGKSQILEHLGFEIWGLGMLEKDCGVEETETPLGDTGAGGALGRAGRASWRRPGK